jgi:hypothetical protein
MRRSPSDKKYSPTQALHTRFSPKMEIVGYKFPKNTMENKPEASSMLMLPKQGIFGTLTKGLSTLNKAIDKGQQLHQQATQVYSKIPIPYPQQPQVMSQPPQPYPQQPIKIPQMRIHSSIVKKQCSY